MVNEERFGYQSCPCRLADGEKLEDLDIVCPCDYRDPDLNDYGSCYCGLYVSDEIVKGQDKIKVVPERRPAREDRAQIKAQISKQAEDIGSAGRREGAGEAQENEAATRAKTGAESRAESGPAYPVWRCRVCGYLCAREEPPGVCPICKAKKDRFERFVF
jgi:ferredoxin-thioredoxin reductase catalytic subunit/predicted Zn-ribbon and HTH transcriptional regulator